MNDWLPESNSDKLKRLSKLLCVLLAVFLVNCGRNSTNPGFKVAAPSITPPSGTYTIYPQVIISCTTEEAEIRYTTDGNEPTTNSFLYTNPINITHTTCLRAKAFLDGWEDSESVTGEYIIADYLIGTEQTFDIMTWNIEEFPQSESTIGYVTQIIDSLQMDIIAMQEIISESAMNQLQNSFPEWSYYRANTAYADINLAYFYKSSLEVLAVYEIYADDYYVFPRSPLVMELNYAARHFVLINNHFKAYSDEESVNRRREASIKLKQYCDDNFEGENVVIMGDLNDSITDGQDNNVFLNFLDSDDYLFADQAIAEGSSMNWSYFSLSHIDHIIISNELFDVFALAGSFVMTVKAEKITGSESLYREHVSDHRPVAIMLKVNQN